jgi:hypothetical protein
MVTAVAVTADGLVVSGGVDGAVRLWDPALPGDPGRELARHHDPVNAVAVTADERLFVATRRGITMFRMTTPNVELAT